MVLHDSFNTISMFGADIDQWSCLHQIEPLKAVLSEDEIQRAGRFKFEQLQQRFLWGRIFLRQVLSCLTGVQASEIQFGVGFNGKPFLLNLPERGHFSFSRSDRFVVCCFSTGSAVGIDVELPKKLDDLSAMSQTIFSDSQFVEWDSLPNAEKQLAFYRAWTRKEAVSKIDGRGISNGVANIEVPLGRLDQTQASCVELHETVIDKVSKPAGLAVLSDWSPFDEVVASVAFEADIPNDCEVEFCDRADYGKGSNDLVLLDGFPIVSNKREFSLIKKANR